MLEVQRWKAGMISSNKPDIKAVFRARVTIRDKKRHSEMVAGSTHQEDTTIGDGVLADKLPRNRAK